VILSGVTQDLRRAFPAARIVVFAGATNAATARLLPGVDEVVPLPITSPLRCIRALRRHPVDVLLDFAGWSRISAVYAAFARARWRAGFRTDGQHRHAAYDASTGNLPTQHELQNFRDLAALVGAEGRALPRIPVPDDAPAPLPSRYVVLHAWPSGTMRQVKEWPLERWAALARRALDDGLTIALSGSSHDAPRSAELARAIGADERVVDLAGRLPFDRLPVLLARAAAVVSVNTGIAHLAAAAGARTLCLNGPTAVHRWGPLGPRVRNIVVPPPHGGYLHLGFEYEGRDQEVMRRIEVDEVWEALRALLAGDGPAAADARADAPRLTTAGAAPRPAGGPAPPP
jgi:heptosyltransferase I